MKHVLNLPNLTQESIAQALNEIPQGVTELDVSNNILGRLWSFQLKSLFKTIPSSIRTLDLSNNGLNRQTSCENLGNALLAIPSHVRTVILNGNNLEDLEPDPAYKVTTIGEMLFKLIENGKNIVIEDENDFQVNLRNYLAWRIQQANIARKDLVTREITKAMSSHTMYETHVVAIVNDYLDIPTVVQGAPQAVDDESPNPSKWERFYRNNRPLIRTISSLAFCGGVLGLWSLVPLTHLSLAMLITAVAGWVLLAFSPAVAGVLCGIAGGAATACAGMALLMVGAIINAVGAVRNLCATVYDNVGNAYYNLCANEDEVQEEDVVMELAP